MPCPSLENEVTDLEFKLGLGLPHLTSNLYYTKMKTNTKIVQEITVVMYFSQMH